MPDVGQQTFRQGRERKERQMTALLWLAIVYRSNVVGGFEEQVHALPIRTGASMQGRDELQVVDSKVDSGFFHRFPAHRGARRLASLAAARDHRVPTIAETGVGPFGEKHPFAFEQEEVDSNRTAKASVHHDDVVRRLPGEKPTGRR